MIDWLTSKVSVLLFAVIVFVSLLSVAAVVKNFQFLESSHREVFSLARIIDAVCSAPFNLQNSFALSATKQVTAGQSANGFFVSVSGIKRGVHCKVQSTSFNASLVNVKKANGALVLS